MMLLDFPLFPEQASSVARYVDELYIFLVLVTGAVSLLIWLVIFYFAIKYRRRPDNELAQEQEPPTILEIAWTAIPTAIFLGIFVWGSWVFFRLQRVPDEALDVYATGRQWMWKFQHPSGQREINSLHVPVGRPVRITMASEDVIHSLWIPAFRVKNDVLPNRYRTLWFEATKTGRYHIFCAEYCGTLHSGMIGWVTVMQPDEYQRWLAGGTEGSLASQGEKLFQKYACNTCHTTDSTGRGPILAGIYGKSRPLANGQSVVADDNYIRESILNPQAKIVKGFGPIMPTFQGQVSEEDLIKLLAYVKSLGATTMTPPLAPESAQSQRTSAGAPALGAAPSPTGAAPSIEGRGATAQPGQTTTAAPTTTNQR
jgi:cytochrome c oxidase subunit 2